MDYLLPDEKTIEIMNEEYSKQGVKNASIFALNSIPARGAGAHNKITIVFALYIMFLLRYNVKYGTEIFDSHRSMGRVQPIASTFRVLNHLERG